MDLFVHLYAQFEITLNVCMHAAYFVKYIGARRDING